jgi:hypothetical protein
MSTERKSSPTFMYHAIQGARLFQHPDDVPRNEGWHDSPGKAAEAAAKRAAAADAKR